MLRFLVLLVVVGMAWGHGRLIDPAGRSTMWRYGFKNPVNYDDDELYCGGISVLWQRNGGKCGICGDAWHLKEPRPNEDGGKYGKGLIAKTYKMGQQFTAVVTLTANHMGYFEFKVCPVVEGGPPSTQECLDKYPLELADGSGSKYIIRRGGAGDFKVDLKLPQGLTCDRCVLQWHYRAANQWGICENENGRGRMGCGPQEYFRGCADIKITS